MRKRVYHDRERERRGPTPSAKPTQQAAYMAEQQEGKRKINLGYQREQQERKEQRGRKVFMESQQGAG